MLLTLPHLVACTPPEARPRFKNALFADKTPVSDIKQLGDTYREIVSLWENTKTPEVGSSFYEQTKPKIEEIIIGLGEVIGQLPIPSTILTLLSNAQHDNDTASMYAGVEDFPSAAKYQSYSLLKLHEILDKATREVSKPRRGRFSSFNEKFAYGMDISGEITGGSEEIANRENQTNINDTAQPQDHHETGENPLNLLHDTLADEEFPDLLEHRNHWVTFPPRTR